MRHAGLTAALLLATAPFALPVARADDGPAAVVHGREVSRDAVHREFALQRLRSPRGPRDVERFLDERLATEEAARQGIVVTDDEVQDAAVKAAVQMAQFSGGDAAALDKFLRESGVSPDDFRREIRFYVSLQKMAAKDLGRRGEVPNAEIQIWLRDLHRRRDARGEPDPAGTGHAAHVGERPITLEEFGAWLVALAKPGEVLPLVQDLAFEHLVGARAETEGIALGTGDVEAEIATLRGEFLDQPSIEGSGVTFEDFLRRRQGISVAELAADKGFRMNLLARKVVGRDIDDAALRAHFEARPEAFGEKARIRRIVVKGTEGKTAFGRGTRAMNEARRIIDGALDRIERGTPFEQVARATSEDFPPEGPRGQVWEVARESNDTAIPFDILDAIFSAREGAVIGPLAAVDGWHLVEVVRRIPAPTFEQARADVRRDLESRKVREWRLRARDDEAIRIADDLRSR